MARGHTQISAMFITMNFFIQNIESINWKNSIYPFENLTFVIERNLPIHSITNFLFNGHSDCDPTKWEGGKREIDTQEN